MLTTTLAKTYADKPHENVPCPLCDAKSDHVLAREGFPGIPVVNVICRGCGLIRINPRMTQEGYDAFYKEDFFEYLNPYDRPGYVEEIERTTDDAYETPTKRFRLPYILEYVKAGGRVLDVGAGFGQVLYLLKKEKNIEAVGIEPDPFSREIAKNKMGIDLADTTIEEFLKNDHGIFDFIYLDQVFEHLLSPLDSLKGMADILSPEGIIYIGVPNAWNPQISMKLFYQIAHTYNYTPATLRRFADQAGLKVVSLRDPEGYPLEAMLAHKSSSFPEEDMSRMVQGKNWRDTARTLRRKQQVNTMRNFAKRISMKLLGSRGKEKLRSVIDRVVRFKY